MIRVLIGLVLSLSIHSVGAAQMRVSADFEGGSAVVRSLEAEQQFVHIQPAVHKDRGWPCWWYCRIDGLSIGKAVAVKVSANPAPFSGTQVLSHTWSLPDRAAFSCDNVHWKQTSEAQRDKRTAIYALEASAETMWVAWGPPFLPSRARELLQQVSDKHADTEVVELARTRGDRAVHAIRLGARPPEDNQPYGIWIQARQHAWEAGSSWVAQGFLLWAVSDAPMAVELRRKATIYVVPIMDVDNVAEGAGGKASVPRDHNRDWDHDPEYPEVRAAQQQILRLHQQQRFDLFVDLHNPGPNDRMPFFFGPKLGDLEPITQRNFVRWHAIAQSTIEHLESDYRFAAYIKTQEEQDRVSSNWVRKHTSPHVVAMTLETPWNRPAGNQDGYKLVGQQLGYAIAEYLRGDPLAE